jgi:hypothetical protein
MAEGLAAERQACGTGQLIPGPCPAANFRSHIYPVCPPASVPMRTAQRAAGEPKEPASANLIAPG